MDKTWKLPKKISRNPPVVNTIFVYSFKNPSSHENQIRAPDHLDPIYDLSLDPVNGLNHMNVVAAGISVIITATSFEHNCVSDHWQFDCLFNSMFKLITKDTSKVSIACSFCEEFVGNRWIHHTKS